MNQFKSQFWWGDYLHLIRPGYWIKNVFVAPGILLAFYFVPGLDLAKQWLSIVLALISACLVASSNYVINEILDAPGDAHHPDKKTRPIASGRIGVGGAYVLWLVLAVLGLALAALVNKGLLASCALLWVMGLTYNVPPVRLKDVPYGDVLSESVNNPIRMAIGWYAMGVSTAPTLSVLLAYWMFGAFLMAIKRYAELRHLGDAAVAGAYRKSFRWYNEERLLVSILFYAALFGMFSGVFISRYRIELTLAIPFVGLAMASYFRIGFKPHSPAMNPERLWRYRSIMVPALFAFVVCGVLLFVNVAPLSQLFAPRYAPVAFP
ncbi:MAG: UbiA family prenyltransferase [Kiritimatiellae bacterium]|nr:UbiA family prenyltransferase [Kiritimatiellia bacterium]